MFAASQCQKEKKTQAVQFMCSSWWRYLVSCVEETQKCFGVLDLTYQHLRLQIQQAWEVPAKSQPVPPGSLSL